MADQNRTILALSAQIVAAHSGHNAVDLAALPKVIRSVYNALVELAPTHRATAHEHALTQAHAQPHVHAAHTHEHIGHSHAAAPDVYVHPTYGQTVFGDHLICMEDGLSMKMLKRHLLTVHGMTPEDYRAKWGLPESYPMVAREYAKLRSSLALQSGLGLKPDDRSGKGRKIGR